MKKQPEVTKATRQRIIDAFWRLFERKEIEDITAGALSSAALIHRSTFYRYFPDVYAVLEAYEDRVLTALREEIASVRAVSCRDMNCYALSVTDLLAGYAYKLYRLSHSTCGSSFRRRFTDTLHEEIRAMYGLPETLGDLDYYAALMTSILLENLTYWYENKDRYSFADINSMCQVIIGDGLKRIDRGEIAGGSPIRRDGTKRERPATEDPC